MVEGQLGIALAAVLLALMAAAWCYGVYCYVQMARHRKPGVPPFSIVWPAEYLTKRGLEFRRRAFWSYAAFGVLALLLVLLGRLAGR
jgi:hypothetical protein